VNSFVGAFHDAVILYALALNDTLAAGENPVNGTAITGHMWNRTFTGRTAFMDSFYKGQLIIFRLTEDLCVT